MTDKYVFPVKTLRNFIIQALSKVDVSEKDGEIVASNLLQADLWGTETHGISRLPVYFKRLREGVVNPCPVIRISNPLPTILAVNGDNGLGSVITTKALEAAMVIAAKYGMSAAGIKGSNHYGAAGYYCNIAARQNYLSIILADSPAAMPPWGGKEAYFGTNPLAIGLPRRDKPPVLVDMATSVVARGENNFSRKAI